MLIARQKLEENIAEYILYMYQVEDIIRGYKFDVDIILENLVEPQISDQELLKEYRLWYKNLINDLKNQRKEKTGHLLELNEIFVELSYLHAILLGQAADKKYIEYVNKAQIYIEEFREKSNLKGKNDIEVSFGALYMKLLLRLQKKEISPQTEQAFEAMSLMLAYLSKFYHKMKRGDLNFLNN